MRVRAYLAFLTGLALCGAVQAQPPKEPPAPIRMGQTLSGELKEGDAVERDGSLFDTYAFTGKKGQLVEIAFQSRDFDPVLVLALAKTKVAENDNGGRRNGASRLVAELPEDGVYTIIANAYEEGSTGPYSLSLKIAVPPRPRTPAPRPIFIGKTAKGELTKRAGMAADGSLFDLYRFRGKAGETVQIILRSPDFDPYVSIHRAGDVGDLAFNDNEGPTNNARLTFTLPADGAYDIRANAAEAGETGAYSLRVERRGLVDAKAIARDVGYGDTVRGQLAFGDARAPDESYYDLYRFKGARGDEVKVVMRSAAMDAYLSVRAAGAERELAAADDDGFGDRDAELPFVLPADGIYEIWANSMRRGESGDYEMSIERIGRSPEAMADTPPAKTPRKPS